MKKFYIYIILINTLDLLSVLSAKMWSITHKPLYLVGCCLGFASAGLFFALALEYEGSAITNILWIAISIILVTVMGYFLFKEQISGLQFLGISIILVGVILINVK